MAKNKTQYVCQSCGALSPKWIGQCADCGAWNSYVETVVESARSRGISTAVGASRVQKLDQVSTREEQRISSGLAEMDRVLG
ncbi:MAG: DNA repair protein RadA, partial [Stenotrophobium sp.]